METTQPKPKCQFVGEDGNVFVLIGKASKTLKRAGLPDKAREMQERVIKSQSYHEALAIMGEYVEIC